MTFFLRGKRILVMNFKKGNNIIWDLLLADLFSFCVLEWARILRNSFRGHRNCDNNAIFHLYGVFKVYWALSFTLSYLFLNPSFWSRQFREFYLTLEIGTLALNELNNMPWSLSIFQNWVWSQQFCAPCTLPCIFCIKPNKK